MTDSQWSDAEGKSGLEWSEPQRETDALCCWLARFPADNNRPRPVLPGVVADSAVDGVVVVGQEQLLSSAFATLTAGGFLGCPVVDGFDFSEPVRQAAHTAASACLAHAALPTHCLCCVAADYDDALDAFYVPAADSLKKRWSDFFDLRRFQLATVGGLLQEQRNAWDGAKLPCPPCYTGSSTLSVLEQMARVGTHRVAILTDEGRVHGLVTQSMLISLFSQQMERLGALREVLVGDITDMLAPGAHTVTEEVLTINALQKMARCRVAGLGVVNAAGSLVGCISVSDLHGVGCDAEQFERLWYPVHVFLWKQSLATPSTVLLSDTLETVIRRMEDGYVHLVFVVAHSSKGGQVPLFAITQRDVLRIICSKMGMGHMS